MKRASRRPSRRRERLLVALLVAAIATAMVVVEPLPKGPVLIALTTEHGVDAGDLPAIVLYLAAGWIALA
jgi:hypothetical protein